MPGLVSLGQHRVTLGRITIPRVGAWSADVQTDDEIGEAELSASLTLTLADLSLVGVRVRGEAWQGSTRVRLVGGAGGWRRVLAPRWYVSDAGVRSSTVLADLARDTGETVAPGSPLPTTLGPAYARGRQAGSATLADLARYAPGQALPWWVAPDGTTHLEARATGLVGAAFDLTGYDATRGIVEVGTETPAAFAPGLVLTSPRLPQSDGGRFTISDVVHRIEGGRIRSDLWVYRGAASWAGAA